MNFIPRRTFGNWLVNPATPSAKLDAIEVEAAGLARGLQVQILNVSTDAEIDAVFAYLAQSRADVVIATDWPRSITRATSSPLEAS